MNDSKNFLRSLLAILVAIGLPLQLASAHYPHDFHEFVEVSPDFSNDKMLVVVSKQSSSTRPVVPLLSHDAGATWNFHGKGMDNLAKLTSSVMSPLFEIDRTILVTSDGQGVYRTTDGGQSWAKFNNGLADFGLHDSAAGLNGQGGVSYFVSVTGGGLYRLAPGATSWVQLLGSSIVVTALAVSPDYASDQTLLVGDQNGQLWRSTNGGNSFNLLSASPGGSLISLIRFTPDYAVSGEVYVGTGAGLFVSSDYLATLDATFVVGYVSALALSPDYRSDGTLFFTTPTQGVFKTTDRGQSWALNETGVELVSQTTFHFHDLQVSRNFSNDGTIYLATFEGLFRSTDYGGSWDEMETRPPTLIMGVAMSPHFSDDGLMLVSTYGGGLYVSEDAGVNWRISSIGVTSPYVYDVAIADGPGADPVLLSAHLNHLLISQDLGQSWVEKEIADVLPGNCIANKMAVSPDYANDGTVYLGCRQEGIIRTQDSGNSWSLVLGSQNLAGGTVTSIALSPAYASDQTLMMSEHRGYFARSTDRGQSWQQTINGLPTPGRWYGGRGLTFSPNYQNDNLVTAATEKGLYASPNRGLNWYLTDAAANPVGNGVVQHFAFSPDYVNDRTVLTSLRGKGLYRSDNSTSGWEQAGSDGQKYLYEIQKLAFSPNFVNDGLIIGWGHDQLYRSSDRGGSFETFDIPFVRHEQNRKQSVLYNAYWQEFADSQASGASFRASATTGREVSLRFYGTGVRWIGARASVFGIADVYLDDQLVDSVDQYSPTSSLQQVLYETQNLPLETHEIRLVVSGNKNPASLATWVLIDAFDVIR